MTEVELPYKIYELTTKKKGKTMAQFTLQEELFLKASKKSANDEIEFVLNKTRNKIKVLDFISFCVKNETFDVNISNGDGNTALHVAANKGEEEIVNVLLTSKVLKTNQQNAKGKTPVMMAHKANFTDIEKAIQAYADFSQEAFDIIKNAREEKNQEKNQTYKEKIDAQNAAAEAHRNRVFNAQKGRGR